MNRKEAFYFAGKCLTLEEGAASRDEVIVAIKSNSVDWEQFVLLCSNHLILPTIYLRFKLSGVFRYLPEDLFEYLQEVYELNETRNRHILKQLTEITQALNVHDICPIFLKGAANLLDGLYPDIGDRIMTDIDLLVTDEDYFKSAEILKGIGYAEVYDTPEWNDIAKAKHYPRLYRVDCVANVEIHRIPVDWEYVKWFNTDIILGETENGTTLAGSLVPSCRHRVIHNFIHSQLSDEGHLLGDVSLREVYDLYLLSKKCSLSVTLSDIKPQQKAAAYFALAGKILGLNSAFYDRKNMAFIVLQIKHSLNLKSSSFGRASRSIVFISQRIFIGYIGLAIKLIYSKEKRQYFYSRISNRRWYGNHVELYTRFFKQNK